MINFVGFGGGIVVEANDFPDYRHDVVHRHHAILHFHDVVFLVFGFQLRQAFPHFPAPDFGKIISFKVEEHIPDQFLGGVGGGEVSRAQTLIDFHQRLGLVVRGIFFDGFFNEINFAVVDVGKQFLDRVVVVNAERPQKRGRRHAPLAVNFHADEARVGGFKFQPRAAVGNDLGAEKILAADVLGGEKHARRAD